MWLLFVVVAVESIGYEAMSVEWVMLGVVVAFRRAQTAIIQLDSVRSGPFGICWLYGLDLCVYIELDITSSFVQIMR